MRIRTKVPKGTQDERLLKLHAWHDFARAIPSMNNEKELHEYMELEKKHYRREYVMLRLMGRISALRTRREKQEIVELCRKGA